MLFKLDCSDMVKLADSFEVTADAIRASRPVVLRAIGVQELAWAFQDYRRKSEGGEGGDGIKWKPISDQTIKNRIRRLKVYKAKAATVRKARKALVSGRKKLARSASIMRQSARNSTEYRNAAQDAAKAGKEIRRNRRKIARAAMQVKSGSKSAAAVERKLQRQVAKLEAKIKASRKLRSAMLDKGSKDRQRIEKKLSTRLDKAKASRQKTMDAKAAGAKIGVDTGRLVNSLTPGVGTSALAATVATATAAAQTATTAISAVAGDTLLQTGASHVTVGTNVNYAPYFDEDRPIFGPNFLSPARRAVLERLVVDATERHLKKALRDKA